MPAEIIIPKGYVTLRLLDKNKRVLQYSGRNIVVYNGRHVISRGLFDTEFTNTNGVVNTLKLASGAVPVDGDHLNPLPMAPTDQDLFESDPSKIKVYSPVYPTLNVISPTARPVASFFVVADSSEVDMVVNEIGMFFGLSDLMFSHYTFNSIDLRAGTNNSLEITWEFTL
jgi:hypothetical protein